MPWIKPTPVPYDPLAWERLPFGERGKRVCQAWAADGYGTPHAILVVYAIKLVGFIGAWVYFCSLSPQLGGLGTIESWWLDPLAFQKAILWSALFEVLGFGCGSGPLTGRYMPPVGGFLYFLRPGTTKRGLLGDRRNWLDVATYAALVVVLAVLVASPHHEPALLIAAAALIAAFFVLDRTVFLATRAEHYWVMIVLFAFAADWVGGAKTVQAALWFWAGFSKLNHHFPSVVAVMTSNGPFTRARWLRRAMYANFPDDLRPSRLAVLMAHAGTALELAVPLVLVTSDGGTQTTVGLGLMLLLHIYITSHVPMAVPIEWNATVVYGGFFLFSAHADTALLADTALPVALFVVAFAVALPLLGNALPRFVSFLLSMRYYAGNWAYSVWLFRRGSETKLDALVKSSPWVHDQLERFYDRSTTVGLIGKVIGFRLMHLHGRALHDLVPKALGDVPLEDVEWLDGEIVAGMALGWNFGDGHLHDERLLASIQKQCGFEEGELRCVFVESQPLGRRTLAYRLADAATGVFERGTVDVRELRKRLPWPDDCGK